MQLRFAYSSLKTASASKSGLNVFLVRCAVRLSSNRVGVVCVAQKDRQVFWSDMINAIIGGIVVCFLLLYQLSFVGQTTAGTIGLTLCAIIIVSLLLLHGCASNPRVRSLL